MSFKKGCRLKISHMIELNKFISEYRSNAIKLLGASYAKQIAMSATTSLDSYYVGLSQHNGDFLKSAIESVKSSHDKYQDGIYAPSLNCVVEFYFIKRAILAVMDHGSAKYQKTWENRPEVIQWGWSHEADRPTHISEKSWNERKLFWNEVGKIKSSNLGHFKFTLIDNKIPPIGWVSIQKNMPKFEWRVAECVRRLAISEELNPNSISDKDKKRLNDRVRKSLTPNLCEYDFSKDSTTAKLKTQTKKENNKKTKLLKFSKKPLNSNSSSIDHADIVVAANGRAFIAVPLVDLKKEDRVYIQVGSKDVTFIQNGVLYGTVRDISTDARDYLRSLTSITLVEVGEEKGQRLLRAKHTAMVNDISINEGVRRPVQKFRRKSRETAIQET